MVEEDIKEINVFGGSQAEWGLFVNVQLQWSKIVLALVAIMLEKESYQVDEMRMNEIGQTAREKVSVFCDSTKGQNMWYIIYKEQRDLVIERTAKATKRENN